MNMRPKVALTFLLLLVVLATKAKKIDLDNPDIRVIGANYVFPSANELHFCRFSEATLLAKDEDRMFDPKKAVTNSGIKLRFKTDSRFVKLAFIPKEGENRGAQFAVLQNNEITQMLDFFGESSKQKMGINIQNQFPGTETLFEIVLPSWANVALVEFEIDDSSSLVNFKEEQKPIYIAIGNSITHGVGQGSASYLTYPYLLAEKLGMDYYNLAVGGAKISQAVAQQTVEMPKADVITILIGHNDLVSGNKTVKEYLEAYRTFLSEIRKNQPDAQIFCIGLTYTRFQQNKVTRVKPDDFRQALEELLQKFINAGDNKLHFIPGNTITSEKNLGPKDGVHLNIDGATGFAEELYYFISHSSNRNFN